MNNVEANAASHFYSVLLSSAIAVLIAVFWQASFLVPLKILVVFFHEASHAIATVLTGGEVLSMRIDPNQGGEVLSRGGMPFLTVSAGYLGSLLIGSALFIAASRSKHDRWILGVLALAMALLTLIYVRNGFGFGFGLLTAAVLFGIAWKLASTFSDFVLKLIGLVSMGYVPLDIVSDTLQRPHLHSDAKILAELSFGTGQMWGLIWLLLSAVFIIFTLWLSLRPQKSEPVLPDRT